MKRLFLLLFVAFALCACSMLPAAPSLPGAPQSTPAPTAPPTDSWKPFSSTAGRFAVSTPKELKESTQSLSTLAGKIDMHMFMADDQTGAVLYMVGYADYPADFLKKANIQDLLKATVEGAVGNIGGKVVSQVAGVQDGMQGREFKGDVPANSKLPGGGIIRGRAFLVSNRQYQVYVLTTKEAEASAQVDKFVNSFKFTAPK